MPIQPTRSDVHVSRPLTNISVAFIQDAAGFVADKFFPIVPVQKQSDRYLSYPPDAWFRAIAAKRAPGTESVGTGWDIDNTPSYLCDVIALHSDVSDQIRANADMDVDRDATELVTTNLLRRRELDFFRSFMKAGLWKGFAQSGTAYDFSPNLGSPSSGASGFGNGYWAASNSQPIVDVDTLRIQMEAMTGFAPNVMILAPDVFYALKNHPLIVDRIKYQGNQTNNKAIVTEDYMAALFGVDKLLVAHAVLNSSQEGQPGNYNFIFSNSFLLGYSAPTPGLMRPSAGYIFAWTGYLGAGAYGNRMSKFRMEHLRSDRVEGEMAYGLNVVASQMAVMGTKVLHA